MIDFLLNILLINLADLAIALYWGIQLHNYYEIPLVKHTLLHNIEVTKNCLEIGNPTGFPVVIDTFDGMKIVETSDPNVYFEIKYMESA